MILLVTVRDMNRYNRRGKNLKYHNILFNAFRLKDNGRPNPIYNIIEIEISPKNTSRRPRFLKKTRFYNLPTIDRSVHIIPTNFKEGNTFYVNNYINWD